MVAESRKPEVDRLVARAGVEAVELQDSVFQSIVDAETPQGIAAEIEIPAGPPPAGGSCVFLEGIQDAGNVGAIIRSAAAFGVGTVVLDNQCADAWSPKTLRAGMGGHFALCIRSVPGLRKELETFPGRLLCTVARDGVTLSEADLAGRIGWVFGREGSGLSDAARENADALVTIPLAAGIESLNVAAAAAICFYEGRRRT